MNQFYRIKVLPQIMSYRYLHIKDTYNLEIIKIQLLLEFSF